jgi:hypothetical protein
LNFSNINFFYKRYLLNCLIIVRKIFFLQEFILIENMSSNYFFLQVVNLCIQVNFLKMLYLTVSSFDWLVQATRFSISTLSSLSKFIYCYLLTHIHSRIHICTTKAVIKVAPFDVCSPGEVKRKRN